MDSELSFDNKVSAPEIKLKNDINKTQASEILKSENKESNESNSHSILEVQKKKHDDKKSFKNIVKNVRTFFKILPKLKLSNID